MTVETTPEEQVLQLLTTCTDPEIPVLNIVEMGIVRRVRVEDDEVSVDVTPTYSGCPAMHAIESEIVRILHRHGYEKVRVKRVFEEPWTTAWMTDEARDKLREFGIAPPLPNDLVDLETAPIPCPTCDSSRTRLTSTFGSTACKAFHVCDACGLPFEHFKNL